MSDSSFSPPSSSIGVDNCEKEPGSFVGLSHAKDQTISIQAANPVSSAIVSAPQALDQSHKTTSGRARGKSISISSVVPKSDSLPNIPRDTPIVSVISNAPVERPDVNRTESITPVPLYQSHILPHSPVSPHRAKPRRSVSHDPSPEPSEPQPAGFLTTPDESIDHPPCSARAHADRGVHFHPSPEDADELGTEDYSSDLTSSKAESESGNVETESAAGSLRTEAGSSAPPDTSSEGSNSDIEIYLDGRGLDDSAMRSSCVGNSSFVGIPLKQTGVDLPTSALDIHAAESNTLDHQTKSQHDDNEGWITSRRTTEMSCSPNSQLLSPSGHSRMVPPNAQEGMTTLSTEGRLATQDVSLKPSANPAEERGRNDTVPLRDDNPKLLPTVQNVKLSRLTSDLKPTSADFKPRMGIELKPSVVDFKPSRIDFNSRVTYNNNFPTTNRVATANRSIPAQNEVIHPFQSNRALADHEFQLPKQVPGRLDDTLYFNKLPSQDGGIGQISPPADECRVLDDQFLEPEDALQAGSLDDSYKTPNVYINGLPPHFPEDQLYALAAPFGEVRSVRTFTRHVRDSESGYGFVLFATIEGAERCINALRKYRNLHPTFSKQIHKIPGTVYAQTFSQNGSETMDSVSSWNSKRDEGDSFKRRMESLQDPTSTNLYMEGLPLSIDEPTLAALVSPHRISSSRFFQTRLSHPPRIIAFVRLETRAGAEEIIERLHGRMVRGWNDTGSRISVRFADTTEQRELRRTERTTKEEDTSTSRLTIAQAALLNLRGQEIRQAAQSSTLPVIGERRRLASNDPPYNEYSNAIQLPNPQTSRPVFEVDYTLVAGRNHAVQGVQVSSPGFINSPYARQYGGGASRTPDTPVAILLENLRGANNTLRGGPVYDTYGQQYSSVPRQSHQYVPDNPVSRPSSTHARSGYTATEEYIMRAHAESRQRGIPLDLAAHARNRREHELDAASANITTGVRGYRAHAATLSLDRKNQSSTLTEIEPVSMANENEFHATATRKHDERPRLVGALEQDPDVTVRGTSKDYNLVGHVSRQTPHMVTTPALSSQPQFTTATLNEQYHHQHVRSTTFPYRPTGTQHPRHQQHNSMSIPNTGQRTPQHASTAVMVSTHDKGDYQDAFEKQNLRRDVGNKLVKLQRVSNSALNQSYDLDNQSSPSLISPTLTYSSQTPATLSPATPFFGSFNSQNDGFDRSSGLVEGKKLRAAGH